MSIKKKENDKDNPQENRRLKEWESDREKEIQIKYFEIDREKIETISKERVKSKTHQNLKVSIPGLDETILATSQKSSWSSLNRKHRALEIGNIYTQSKEITKIK